MLEQSQRRIKRSDKKGPSGLVLKKTDDVINLLSFVHSKVIQMTVLGRI